MTRAVDIAWLPYMDYQIRETGTVRNIIVILQFHVAYKHKQLDYGAKKLYLNCYEMHAFVI